MLDDLSQAEQQEPITSDANAPETNSSIGSAQAEQPKEPTFTLDEVRKMIRTEVAPLIQSQVAKSENRMTQRIQERFQALDANKGVLNLSDEQVAEAKRSIVAEEQMNSYSPEASQQPDRDAAAPDGVNPEVFFANVQQIFQKEGVQVTPADPEFKEIEKAWNDPNGNEIETLLAFKLAARQKSARISSLKAGAPARVMGGGQQGTNSTKPKTAEEKIAAGLKSTNWDAPKRN